MDRLNAPSETALENALVATRQTLTLLRQERNPVTIRTFLKDQIRPETDTLLAAINTGEYSPLFFSKEQPSPTVERASFTDPDNETQRLLSESGSESDSDIESGMRMNVYRTD